MDSAAISLLQFCQQLPKVELHAHLNTSYSMDTLQELTKLNPGGDEQSVQDLCIDPNPNPGGDEQSVQDLCIDSNQEIDESFKLFFKIQRLVRTEETVYTLTRSVIKEYAADNVKYLELRSTPKEIPETGMTRELYIRTMVRAIRDCEKAGLDIVVRLLVSIDRRHGVKVAEITVDLAEKLKKETEGLVVGIDLSGDPKVGDATDFIPALLDASNRGLKLALHLAELPLYDETKNVLQSCAEKCDMRIGHGTFIHRYEPGKGFEEIENIVVKAKVPIEACLTSNLRTLTVDRLEQHHFKYWLEKSHPIILCCDGKGAYGSTLTEEYHKAAQTFVLSRDKLKQYVISTIDSIFENEQIKSQLREQFRTILEGLN